MLLEALSERRIVTTHRRKNLKSNRLTQRLGSGGALFEPRQGAPSYFVVYIGFSHSAPGKFRASASIKLRPLASRSLPIHYPTIRLDTGTVVK
jgi:hypothetical protein